jgi:hypothetical protein
MAVILNASTSSGFVQSADTSGEINLQSNGSTKLSVLSTGVSGTLVQGTAVASTSGTSIDFTAIPSWVKRITVMFSGVSTNGTSFPLIQLGDSGGVETTGYISVSGLLYGSTPATTNSTAGFVINSNLATNTHNGALVISLLGSNAWVCQGSVCGTVNANQSITVTGSKTLSDVLDRVRITTVNGTDTFDAGTINIQYEG